MTALDEKKDFILTKDGAEKLQPVMESQEGFEEKAVLLLGEERLERLTALMLDYDQALNAVLSFSTENEMKLGKLVREG